jgi:surfeit locus 1 family protein
MVLGLAALIRLGFWQLHRADYKRGLIRDYAATSNRPAVSLAKLTRQRAAAHLPRYVRVKLRGHYDSRHQVLINEMQHAGRVGFYVLTPFKRADGRTVLVNRGWIPANGHGRPEGSLPVAETRRSIRGMLGKLPVPGIRLGGNSASLAKKQWPRIMFYPTRNDLETLYGQALFARVVLLSPHANAGFVRDWKPDIGLPPTRHLAYAVQWFALALTLLIVWLLVNVHRRADPLKSI